MQGKTRTSGLGTRAWELSSDQVLSPCPMQTAEVVRLPRDIAVVAVGSDSLWDLTTRKASGRLQQDKSGWLLANLLRLEQSGKGGNPEPRSKGDERNLRLKVRVKW